MNETEDRLLRRIDARRAIARLTPRQRDVLVGRVRYQQTYHRIADDLNISHVRVSQLYDRALIMARRVITAQPVRSPAKVPHGFDRAAFIEHMRGCVARRDLARSRQFELDVAELARLVRREQEEKASPPLPDAAVAELVEYYKQQSTAPWKPPEPQPPNLQTVALQALRTFLSLRQPTRFGSQTLGTYCTNVTYPWRTGHVAEAVRELEAEIPKDAFLSVCVFAVLPGYTGAQASNGYISMRAMMESNGEMVRLDVTWDRADGH